MSLENVERPKSRNAVLIFTDENYAPAAYFVAQQALRALDGSADVVVATSDVTTRSLIAQTDPRLRAIGFPSDLLPVSLPVRVSRPRILYARLVLDRLVGTDYDRVIYLDCDIWICSKDFARLFELEMRGNAIAAVRDAHDLVPDAQLRWTERIPGGRRRHCTYSEYKARLGLGPQDHYFNSGVLLVDVAKYRSEDIGGRALSWVTGPDFMGPWHDQSGLNYAVKGKFSEISLLWNWQASLQDQQTSVSSGAKVLHFSGRSKPWNDYLGRLNPIYASMMRSELGNTPWPKFVRSASEVGPWTYRFPRYIKHRVLLGPSATGLHRRRLAAAKAYLASGRFADVEQGLVGCCGEMIG